MVSGVFQRMENNEATNITFGHILVAAARQSSARGQARQPEGRDQG